MAGWLQTTNKNKSRFIGEKIPVVAKMGDINARLAQLDKKYAELKADIDKNNNDLTGLKARLDQRHQYIASRTKEDTRNSQHYLGQTTVTHLKFST